MAKQGELYLFPLVGFWADVGQPKDFLIGSALNLKSLSVRIPEKLRTTIDGGELSGCVMIHDSAKIGLKCKIGPNVVIGAKCVIGDGVRLSNCVILPNSTVKEVCDKNSYNSFLGCICEKFNCRVVFVCR